MRGFLRPMRVAGSATAIAAALLTAPNLLLSPHIGSATQDARLAMLEHVVGNVRAFLEERPLTGLV